MASKSLGYPNMNVAIANLDLAAVQQFLQLKPPINLNELTNYAGNDLCCDGWSGGAYPLCLAAYFGQWEMIRLLFVHGANFDRGCSRHGSPRNRLAQFCPISQELKQEILDLIEGGVIAARSKTIGFVQPDDSPSSSSKIPGSHVIPFPNPDLSSPVMAFFRVEEQNQAWVGPHALSRIENTGCWANITFDETGKIVNLYVDGGTSPSKYDFFAPGLLFYLSKREKYSLIGLDRHGHEIAIHLRAETLQRAKMLEDLASLEADTLILSRLCSAREEYEKVTSVVLVAPLTTGTPCDPSICPRGGLSTALHFAIEAKDGELFRRLVKEQPGDMHVHGNGGDTPMHTACCYSPHFVQELLAAGANMHLRNQHGQTPLHLAVYYRAESAVRSLLERGADKKLTNNRGQIPLDIALDRPATPLIIQLLLAAAPGTSSAAMNSSTCHPSLCPIDGESTLRTGPLNEGCKEEDPVHRGRPAGSSNDVGTRIIETQRRSGRWRALMIGINEFKGGPRQSLRGAESDALALREFFQAHGYESTQLLIGQEATGSTIEDAIDAFCNPAGTAASKLTKDDTIVVYFATHGYYIDGHPWIAACDNNEVKNKPGSSVSSLGRNGLISFNEIAEAMRRSLAGTKVLLLDACHSALELRTRGSTSEPLCFKPNDPSGLMIVTACHANQTAIELPTSGRGLFTSKLIEFLRSNPTERFDVVATKVRDAVEKEAAGSYQGHHQVPWINGMILDDGARFCLLPALPSAPPTAFPEIALLPTEADLPSTMAAASSSSSPPSSSSSFRGGSEENKWQCPTCRLTNAELAVQCSSCATPRNPLHWRCHHCTLLNENLSEHCIACQGIRPFEAEVIHAFAATRQEQLSLRQGDVVLVQGMHEGGWWSGLDSLARRGFFPGSYVHRL